jgi:hypothetical protein
MRVAGSTHPALSGHLLPEGEGTLTVQVNESESSLINGLRGD